IDSRPVRGPAVRTQFRSARWEAPDEAMQFTLSELWAHMGLFARGIVFVLGVMSLSSLVVLGERLLVYMKSKNESRDFAERMGPILAGGDLDAASGTKFGKDIGHLGRVITAGLGAFRANS